MDWVYEKADVPTCEHYAIIEFSSIHIPGDQRSIDAPGHGYPESTERIVKYIVFKDAVEWIGEIKRRMMNTHEADKFVPLHARPASVRLDIEVNVSVS
jgi:hypothetical protein